MRVSSSSMYGPRPTLLRRATLIAAWLSICAISAPTLGQSVRIVGFRDQAVFAPFSGIAIEAPRTGEQYSLDTASPNRMRIRSVDAEQRISDAETKLSALTRALSSYLPDDQIPGTILPRLYEARPLLAQSLLEYSKGLTMEDVEHVVSNDDYRSRFWTKYPELKRLGYNDTMFDVALNERVEDIVAERMRIRPNRNHVVSSRPDSLELYTTGRPEDGSFLEIQLSSANDDSECSRISFFWGKMVQLRIDSARIRRVLKRFEYHESIKDLSSLAQAVENGCQALEAARRKSASSDSGPTSFMFRGPFFRAVTLGPVLPSVGGGVSSSNPYVSRLQIVKQDIAEAYLLSPPIDRADELLQKQRAGSAYRRALFEEVGKQVREGYDLVSEKSRLNDLYNGGIVKPNGSWIVRSVSVKNGEFVQANQKIITWRNRDYAEISADLSATEYKALAEKERLKPVSIFTALSAGCGPAAKIELYGEFLNFEERGDRFKVILAVSPKNSGGRICLSGKLSYLGEMPRDAEFNIQLEP